MWLGTSWKMGKTLAEARRWVEAVTAVPVPDGVEAFVLPPHTALATVREAVPAGHRLRVGAQDSHWASDPEWTGEVSVAQVRDAGATLVEVGHSERRLGLGEDDAVVARKLRAVVAGGLTPLLCVGEPADVRRRGGALDHVTTQLRAALEGLTPAEVGGVLVAYEPVWSIGRAGRAASAQDVAPAVEALRSVAAELAGGPGRAVLYGGSVHPGNVEELCASGADGLFVGRAAWEPEGFLRLLGAAARWTGVAQRTGSRVIQ